MGPARIAHTVQSAGDRRLRPCSALASLAVAGARSLLLSRMECVVTADDLHRGCHVAAIATPHNGHRYSVDGATCSDDAWSDGGRLVDHAVRLATWHS